MAPSLSFAGRSARRERKSGKRAHLFWCDLALGLVDRPHQLPAAAVKIMQHLLAALVALGRAEPELTSHCFDRFAGAGQRLPLGERRGKILWEW